MGATKREQPDPTDGEPARPARRAYNSTRRRRQAAQTRGDVLVAAMRLFNARGWTGTTLADIAAEAGVAVETVYSGFGSKKTLVRDAFDAAVVGDAEPIPFVERDEFLRMGRGPIAARVHAGLETLAATHERSAGVWRALQDAAAGDADLEAWVRAAEQRRRVDVGRSLERMFGRPVDELTLDVLWTLYGPEPYRNLVEDAGRSPAEYQHRLASATLRLLGEDLTLLADDA